MIKKEGPHSHNCYFLCWNDASLWVNNTAYNYNPALHIFWEPVLKNHILSHVFLTSIIEIIIEEKASKNVMCA